MQYENISTDLLLASVWHKITMPVDWQALETKVHQELNCYESRGRYNYLHESTIGDDGIEDLMHIWFELEQDATYFALKFA